MRDYRDSKSSRAEGRGAMLPFDEAAVTAIKRVQEDVPVDLLAENGPSMAVPHKDPSPSLKKVSVQELNHTDWSAFQKIVDKIAHLRAVQNLPPELLPDRFSIPDGLERAIAPESGQVLFVLMHKDVQNKELPVGLALGRIYDANPSSQRDPEEDEQAPAQEINVTLLHALLRGKGVGKFLVDHLKSQGFSRISFDLPALPEPIAFLRSQGARLSAPDLQRLGSDPTPEKILASRDSNSSVRMYINCPR